MEALETKLNTTINTIVKEKGLDATISVRELMGSLKGFFKNLKLRNPEDGEDIPLNFIFDPNKREFYFRVLAPYKVVNTNTTVIQPKINLVEKVSTKASTANSITLETHTITNDNVANTTNGLTKDEKVYISNFFLDELENLDEEDKKLRAQYKAEYEDLVAKKACTSCAKSALMRKYTSILKDKLQKAKQ